VASNLAELGHSSLSRNKEFLQAAANEDIVALKCYPGSLDDDREFWFALLHNRRAEVASGLLNVYKFAKFCLTMNICRRQDIQLLPSCDEMMRSDPDMVMIAMANHGVSLQYASDNLRNNPNVVKTWSGVAPPGFIWNFLVLLVLLQNCCRIVVAL